MSYQKNLNEQNDIVRETDQTYRSVFGQKDNNFKFFLYIISSIRFKWLILH